MKLLFLVRHAKSSRDDPGLPDRLRPLNDRGERDAPKAGKRLAERGMKIDLIVSSPAVRALATARLIADEIGYRRKDIVVDDRLYASSATALLAFVHALEKSVDRVMIVGHNPELAELVGRLSGDNVEMPTCAIAELLYDSKTWAGIGEQAPSSMTLDVPKH